MKFYLLNRDSTNLPVMTADILNTQLLEIYQKYTDSIYAETWENKSLHRC
jgi:hypothetical protein